MKLKIEYRSVSELVPYAQNAKLHTTENVEELAGSIEKFGFLDPVMLDANGVLVWGHRRLLAAQLLGMDEVPTITLPANMTQAEIRALRLAHNKLAEKSKWNSELLRLELEELAALDFDLSFTGFNDAEVANLLRDFEREFQNHTTVREPASPEETNVGSLNFADDEDDTPAATTDNDEKLYDPEPEPTAEPKASDDAYSQYSLIMLHDNKVRLLNVLGELRTEKGLDKQEDALMELVFFYERNK